MEKTGMPMAVVLQSTFIINAKILGQVSELGQIALGFKADMIATYGNKMFDSGTLNDIFFVM